MLYCNPKRNPLHPKNGSSFSIRLRAIRHGFAETNRLGIYSSRPENNINYHGLEPKGVEQVRQSALEAVEQGLIGPETLVVSSDFRRALETAEVICDVARIRRGIQIDKRLRERCVGQFECQDAKAFEEAGIWQRDPYNPMKSIGSVESVYSVLRRVTAVALDCNSCHPHESVWLVSHCAPLYELRRAFAAHNGSTIAVERPQNAEVLSLVN